MEIWVYRPTPLVNIHKNDNNVKHVIVMVFCTQHCIHMTFPSCDDVHCMSHCNNIKGASQAHCKKGHKNKYGSNGKRRTKALSRSMNLDCFAKWNNMTSIANCNPWLSYIPLPFT